MRKDEIHNIEDLMQSFSSGRERSFTSVFNLLYDSLCLYAHKITDDQSAAEDIVEDAFVKIWLRHTQFTDFRILKSYLYTTIRNDSINWLKKQERESTIRDNLAFVNGVDEKDQLEAMISVELMLRINLAISKLPPQCRKIVKLIFIEGKKTKEIAEELNLSVGTIKTQKARGLMLLKQFNWLLIMSVLISIAL